VLRGELRRGPWMAAAQRQGACLRLPADSGPPQVHYFETSESRTVRAGIEPRQIDGLPLTVDDCGIAIDEMISAPTGSAGQLAGVRSHLSVVVRLQQTRNESRT
jgi:hypothetical protein